MSLQDLHTLSQHLKSLLGPHSSDKLCLRTEPTKSLNAQSSEITTLESHFLITNDGATLLSTLPLKGALMQRLVHLSQIQDELVGDGTTSVVLLCDSIINQLNHQFQGTIPTSSQAPVSKPLYARMQALTWKLAHDMIRELRQPFSPSLHIPVILHTCLSSKIVHSSVVIIQLLNKLFASASPSNQKEETNHNPSTPPQKESIQHTSSAARIQTRDQIQIFTRIGKTMQHSFTFQGGIIEKVWPTSGSTTDSCDRTHVNNARILVCRLPILASFQVTGATLNASSLDESFDMMDFEAAQTLQIVQKIIKSDVNVIFQSGRVSPEARQLLEQSNIVLIEGCSIREAEHIAQICDTKVVRHVSPYAQAASISVGVVKRIGAFSMQGEQLIRVDSNHVMECIVLRAPTFSMAAEVERSLHDALCIIFKSLEANYVVPGAGALYIELSHRLRMHALSKESRGDDILIAECMARALEEIPAILARNAGLPVVETLDRLREDHRNGKWNSALVDGVCSSDGLTALEPSSLFLNVLRGALRCASTILFEPAEVSHDEGINVRDLGLM